MNIIGDNGNNDLVGTDFDDTISPGLGTDLVDGNDGDDLLIIDYSSVTGRVNVQFETSPTGGVVSGGGNSAEFSNVERFEITSGSGNDKLLGSNGDDTLSGMAGNDCLDGGLGVNVIDGGLGQDTLVVDLSSDGSDQSINDLVSPLPDGTSFTDIEVFDLTTGSGGDTIVLTGTYNDTINSGAGNDSITAGNGNQTILTADGNDTINLGAGNSTVNAGAGDDFIIPGSGSNSIDGSLGADTVALDLSSSTAHQIIDLSPATVLINGSSFSGVEVFDLTTGVGNDQITDGARNLAAITGAGDDTIAPGTGLDEIDGGTGSDLLVVDYSGLSGNSIVCDVTGDAGTFTYGAGINVITFSGIDRFQITGTIAADQILTSGGDDTLDGDGGADTMTGAAGNDYYIVDQSNDVAVEATDAGIDSVESTASYTLPSEVEYLSLIGSSNLNATGNELNNQLTGNSGANRLDGKTGTDTLIGGSGNDTYVVDSLADVVVETNAVAMEIDKVESTVSFTLGSNLEWLSLGGSLAADGTGNSLNNKLTGNTGANTLDGKSGNDTLIGGAGNDTYLVDSSGDLVVEASTVPAETDVVFSSVSFVLGSNLEKLVLTGASVADGVGNAAANSITGNSAANTLNGKAGNDTLRGGAGEDSYIVDSSQDIVVETSSVPGEIDVVQAGATFVLSRNVENLILTGTASIDGFGNALANSITGNAGDNKLDGADGLDTLNGGAGNDTYLVNRSGDTVIELSASPTQVDRVISTASFTLGNNVERLTLAGDAPVSGIGNELANVVTGNIASNLLDGGAGADTLSGGGGDDTYMVDSPGDEVREASSDPTELDSVRSSVDFRLGVNLENLVLNGGSAALNGIGNDRANWILGNGNANTLDGKIGMDTLEGKAGDDLYLIDSPKDIVRENARQGRDKIRSSVSYTLPDEVEDMVLTGVRSSTGTGNAAANLLVGNSGANRLGGDGRNDSLSGAIGRDTLTGTSALDHGVGEFDRLTGGTENDYFVLGDAAGRYYDDGVRSTLGKGDYAYVADFTPGEDKLQLNGTASDYYLGAAGVPGLHGTGLYFENSATDELIAVLHSGNGVPLTAANTIDKALFV